MVSRGLTCGPKGSRHPSQIGRNVPMRMATADEREASTLVPFCIAKSEMKTQGAAFGIFCSTSNWVDRRNEGLGPRADRQLAPHRIRQAEAACTSLLFEPSTTVNRAQPSPPARAAPSPAASEKPPIDPDSIQDMQDRKLAFLDGQLDKRTLSPDRLQAPASKYLVQAGWSFYRGGAPGRRRSGRIRRP